MKNIIVVTGGAGFVGSNLIELLLQKTKYKIIDKILKLVLLKIKPLKAITSIRTNNFHINVSSKNKYINKFIIKSGGVLKQYTFELKIN